MKILFLSDKSQNLMSWIIALKAKENNIIRVWSLEHADRKIISRFKRFLQILLSPIRIKKIIREFDPDLLIGYRIPSYGLISILSGHKPVIVTAQGASDLWPPDSIILWLKKLIIKYTIKRADIVHVWANHMADNMKKLGAKEKNIFIKPRGIDIEKFFVSKKMNDRSKRTLKFICTRSMYKEYQHEKILNILFLFKKKWDINFKCTFIGSGPLEDRLIDKSKKLGLTNEVTFLGRINNDKIPELLNESHIYISFPITEGLSASLLEAMACGCLPIVSDLPGNSEIIEDGINGYLVNIKKESSVSSLMKKIWSEKNQLYNCSKINSELIKKEFNINENVKNFIDLYKNLLSKNVKN